MYLATKVKKTSLARRTSRLEQQLAAARNGETQYLNIP